jgi:putative methyltransferase (TIGR04325 family)
MNIKRSLKSFCPPILLELFNTVLDRQIRFSGAYPSWSAAAADATGYAETYILDRAIAATESVLSGAAKFERDGVTFDFTPYPFPLIATLYRAAAENEGKLTVLDFGGALGSSYYQCRQFMQAISYVRWCVVEQSRFVEVGNERFKTEELLFFKEIKTVVAEYHPNVVLFSGVLQYLPEPFAVMDEALGVGADYIIVDRNPFAEADVLTLSVQKIPRQIIKSSYPAWLFGESEFRRFFSDKYTPIATFDALDGTVGRGRLKTNFKGLVLKRTASI